MAVSLGGSANPTLNGRGRRFAVVAAEFNPRVTDSLLAHCLKTLGEYGVGSGRVVVARVPGAFELPLAARVLARAGRYDAVIALGCVIRGETPHDRYISQEVARGLGQTALDTGVPVIFGVLTTLNFRQALARSENGPRNKGREAALAALKMADLFRRPPFRRKA
jgi:6,7-dimethyl-8-ribityllumazine synthase